MGEGRAAGQVHHVLDVLWPHHALVVEREVREQVVGVEVLEVVGADQVVVCHPADREQRRAVHTRVEQAVGQVDRAGTGGGEADAELAGELRVAHGRHRTDLFVAHVDVADPVVARAERLHEAVDPVARKAEDGVHAPLAEPLDEQVRSGLGHLVLRDLR